MNTSREYVPNNLVWAILATLLCCLPLGIVSIVYAAKVDSLVAAGDVPAARRAADSARNWAIAAALSLPVLVVAWFTVFGGLAALGSLGGYH
jgi:hypothetical protein